MDFLQVFPNPQQVMSKFVLNIYHSKLKEHIGTKLADKNKSETYLNNLFQVCLHDLQILPR